MTVTVSMPFHGAHEWLRGAVQSILDQTYTDWRLVIVNDADPVSPWPLIAHIRDPRIVRLDLPQNRGRYFIDEVILEAFEPELWAMQDPDDWSDPRRLERMVPLAQEHGAAFAPSRLFDHGQPPRVIDTGLHLQPVEDRIRHMIGYGSGVISGDRIRAVGGFHADVRVGYDTWLMNAVRLVGPWVAIDKPPLQNKRMRPGSLRTSPATGDGSEYRQAVRARLDAIWRRAWAEHESGGGIAHLVPADISAATHAEVLLHAARLRHAQKEVLV